MKSFWLIVGAVFWLCGGLVAAAETATETAPSGLFLDALEQLPFAPQEIYVFVAGPSVPPLIQPAESLLLQSSSQQKTDRLPYYLRAEIPAADADFSALTHFSFLLLGRERKLSQFTRLQPLTERQHNLFFRTAEDIRRGSAALQKGLEESRAQKLAVEDELRLLRDRAAQIAGINDIVDLKVELANLQGRGRAMTTEVLRLEELMQLGRRLPDPRDSRELQQALLTDLKKTAEVTANADRLNARRHQAAVQTLEQKRALIRETSGYVPETLAREVLRLRGIRRGLEARLGVQRAPTNRDF